MIDFMLVDTPFTFPQACVGCMSQKGPMVDTHRELRGYGHVYVCHICAKTTARLMGFAEGERLDELADAVVALGERDREIASLSKQLSDAVIALAAEQRVNEEQAETNRDLKANIDRLHTEIRHAAESTLAAVSS